MVKKTKRPTSSERLTTGGADHDEWLIDESLEETFPASDATAPWQPGSTVAVRYVAGERTKRVRRRLKAT